MVLKRTRKKITYEIDKNTFTDLVLKDTALPYTVSTSKSSTIEAKLLPNIQFIYELSLARLELHALGAQFEIVNNLRLFRITNTADEEFLRRRVAYFEEINGKKTDYYKLQQYNITRSVNQYLTHWFYPYKGKYHPQMIRAILNILRIQPGETVLDPFIGSGTTALESQILGINCIGIDISPLCCLISKVKTESMYGIDEISKCMNTIKPTNSNSHQPDIFMESNTIEITDDKVKNFYLMAEMIAHSDTSRRGKDFESSYFENIKKMIKSVTDFRNAVKTNHLKLGNVKIIKGDVRKIKLKDNSVDAIITSPPYSIALNYVENDAHSLQALGYDLKRIKEDFIGVRGSGFNKFELYYKDMEKSISEMYRVLKPGKYCVIVIGNVTFQEKEVDTTDRVIQFAKKTGFSFKKKLDKIIYGLYNVMQKEYILFFKKGDA